MLCLRRVSRLAFSTFLSAMLTSMQSYLGSRIRRDDFRPTPGRPLLSSARAGEGLARLDLDHFAFVTNSLAFIRFGLADLTHLGGELPDRLLVRSADVNLSAGFYSDGDI